MDRSSASCIQQFNWSNLLKCIRAPHQKVFNNKIKWTQTSGRCYCCCWLLLSYCFLSTLIRAYYSKFFFSLFLVSYHLQFSWKSTDWKEDHFFWHIHILFALSSWCMVIGALMICVAVDVVVFLPFVFNRRISNRSVIWFWAWFCSKVDSSAHTNVLCLLDRYAAVDSKHCWIYLLHWMTRACSRKSRNLPLWICNQNIKLRIFIVLIIEIFVT